MNKERLVLGTRKGLIILENSGCDWKVIQSAYEGVPISYAAVDPRQGTLWTCADHGHWGAKIYCSSDNGRSFDEATSPIFPEDAVAYDVWDDGAEKPAKVTYIWTIVPGGADQPGRLYVGTEPGGLFVSDDGGQTYELMRGLWDHPSRRKNWFGGGRDQAGVCSIVVDPRDSDHLFAGVSVGGVYESADGGITWRGRNKGLIADYLPDPHAEYGHDPHCLVASPGNPDVLWQQNHCGVFRSENAGGQWHKISQVDGPVNFGFPIAVDEQDASTAWVVPGISDEIRMSVNAAMCVGRTEDGGQTWEEMRQGLPQNNSYDIVYRHALDIDGRQLAFGTTTGNLFWSTDRGESWQTISHYLPPIYSVRFA